MMRQAADKAHGIDQQHLPPVGKAQRPGGGVQGGEKFILRQHAGLRQGVEEGGFARVGIAHDGSRLHAILAAALPAAFPLPLHIVQLQPQGVNPPANVPPVAFQLGFAGSPGADAAAQPG